MASESPLWSIQFSIFSEHGLDSPEQLATLSDEQGTTSNGKAAWGGRALYYTEAALDGG